jgi:hypothetical protein
MVDRSGRYALAIRQRCVALALALALSGVLAGCAGALVPEIPPLRPDLPADLRQPTSPSPDFRLPPPPVASTPTKTKDEQEATIDELEKLRETHENATQKAIEKR